MQTGFSIIHSNDLDVLADAALAWCEREPLAPLEDEIFLVQSRGMADWLRLQQAQRGAGVSAGMRCVLPASFLWQMARRVLAPGDLAPDAPFDKDVLQWRIWRLLPALLQQPEFARPSRFLQADGAGKATLDAGRHLQLARTLADLYDQYQLYRGDWLADWEARRPARSLGRAGPPPADEAWQAALWRAIVADAPQDQRQQSRARLHTAFMQALQRGDPGGLPRRFFLFGINSLPGPLLQALYAMAPYCQILLMVLNPCRQFWDQAEPQHADEPLANPLLGAWGARGRDFMRLLHDCEPTLELRELTQEMSAFVPRAEQPGAPLPLALQQAILDNAAPPAKDQRAPLPPAPGLELLPAWSRQREVEVLHDRLLTLFAEDTGLSYRDVVVMAPDIERYAPHVNAVFGRYAADDDRHLAWSISDRHQMAGSALFRALQWLLALPTVRITHSEVLALLEQPALRARFGLAEDELPQLQRWLAQTFTRWALDAPHKARLLEMNGAQDNARAGAWLQLNTWQAGLDQLLAGYCFGNAQPAGWDGVALDEVGGSAAVVLGQLWALIDRLRRATAELAPPAPPQEWGARFAALLDDFFDPADDAERETLQALRAALAAWQDDCARAGFDDTLPLQQAAQAWLDKVQHLGVSQRLSFTGITFCTLLPMRALPFAHVFLLGMNDGDYPREQVPPDFDLMQADHRPGDRDRRGDDLYLLLEALISARTGLHISWVARDIHKDAALQPAVPVQQLLDEIDARWRGPDESTPAHRALMHAAPLAGFSRNYFEEPEDGNQPARTHAREWRALHAPEPAAAQVIAAAEPPTDLTASDLLTLLAQPVHVFYRLRLRIPLASDIAGTEDDEPFELDGLQRWQLRDALLQVAGDAPASARALATLRGSGQLPAGPVAQRALAGAGHEAVSIHQRLLQHAGDAQPLPDRLYTLRLAMGDAVCTVGGRIGGRHQDARGRPLLLRAAASRLQDKGKRWRAHRLAATWLDHLLANASGDAVHSWLVGLDTYAGFLPMPRAEARQQLSALARLFRRAWQRPLPLTSGAALALLARAQEEDGGAFAARKAFESDASMYNRGNHDADDALVQRAFADFDALWADDGHQFRTLAQALYGCMLHALQATRSARTEEATETGA